MACAQLAAQHNAVVVAVTDDEVRQWLSDEEHILLALAEGAAASGAVSLGEAQRRALRSLAETRKALVSVEWEGVFAAEDERGATDLDPCCVFPQCAVLPGRPHVPTCIFATMPRLR